MEENVIGGEMEIVKETLYRIYNSEVHASSFLPGQLYSSGRSALLAILMKLYKRGIHRILLPDYLCITIVTTVKYAGFEYLFYPLDDDYKPKFSEFQDSLTEGTAILLINYFGLQDLSDTISHIRKQSQSIIIEDDVQALPNYLRQDGSSCDFAFSSLRKWISVPDGGIANGFDVKLTEFSDDNRFSTLKYCGLVLKGQRDKYEDIDSIYLNLLHKGELMIDSDVETNISNVTISLICDIDLQKVESKRIENSSFLINELSKIGINPLISPSSGSVPFFLPIYVKNRDEVRKKLFEHNIFCPVHWPTEGMKLSMGLKMEEHELSLIIDQRYDKCDMARMIDIISQTIEI